MTEVNLIAIEIHKNTIVINRLSGVQCPIQRTEYTLPVTCWFLSHGATHFNLFSEVFSLCILEQTNLTKTRILHCKFVSYAIISYVSCGCLNSSEGLLILSEVLLPCNVHATRPLQVQANTLFAAGVQVSSIRSTGQLNW